MSATLDASEDGRADGQVQRNGGENAKEKEAAEGHASDAEPAPLPPPESLMHLTEHRGMTLLQLRDIADIAAYFKGGLGSKKSKRACARLYGRR